MSGQSTNIGLSPNAAPPRESVGLAWDREVDAIVLGAGPAGMTAAIVANTEGLETLLVEKTSQVGGTAAWSAGMMWFVDTLLMREAGYEDSPEKARRYFNATVGNTAPLDLQEAYIHSGSKAFDYMMKHSELRAAPAYYPDYQPELDGGMFGRAHGPVEFDGRRLGAHFKEVRGSVPAFAPFGGMMMDFEDLHHFTSFMRSPKSILHILKRLARHARDRMGHDRGTRLLHGNALVAQLYKTILDRRIETMLNTSPRRLVMRDGRVAGVELVQDGRTLTVGARRGVVIATGGYPGNQEMRRAHSREPTVERTLGLASNVGEGLRLAQDVGARLDRNNQIDTGYYVPTSEARDNNGVVQWGHFMMDRAKPGFIAVGRDGRRFTNEAASYHAFTVGMFEAGAIPAYLIADAATVRKYGIGLVLPGGLGLRKLERSGYVTSGGTLAALAAKLGIDAGHLQRSVERNNAAALSGVDEDFGKGSSAYDVINGDPTHKPSACLGAIAKPPFHAVRLMPGDFGTSRGLVTGVRGEVLDTANKAIPGLYACGNDMNSPVGGRYIGAGITLGPAITFGYLAGMALANLESGTSSREADQTAA